MSQSEADETGERSEETGIKLKSTIGWNDNGNGTNESGFTALPAGQCNDYSFGCSGMGQYALFWTSTEWTKDNEAAFLRILHSSDNRIIRHARNKRGNASVRCIKN